MTPVALEVNPAEVLAWVAGGFFMAIAWLVQREWKRHVRQHARIVKRLNAIEKGEPPPPEESDE